MTKHTHTIRSIVSAGLVAGALVLAPLTPALLAHAATGSTVTVAEFISGVPATAQSANNASFQLNTNWNDPSLGTGSGTLTLNAGNSYQVSSQQLASGASFGLSEDTSGSTVGPTCFPGGSNPIPEFGIIGYSTGDTMQAAAQSAADPTAPNFTNITADKFVVVWVNPCQQSQTTQATVHVQADVNGTEATTTSANSTLFPMADTWMAANLNGGAQTSGTFTLGNGSIANHPYQYDAPAMDTPASFSVTATTHDVDSASPICAIGASNCTSTQFMLQGYKVSSTSYADAEASALQTTAPSFSSLTGDEYVIVVLVPCQTQSSGTNTVTVMQYVSGQPATSQNTNNASFTVNTNWTDSSLGTGNGTLTLNSGNSYSATSQGFQNGATYSVAENLDGTTVGQTCFPGGSNPIPQFGLIGYSVGNTVNDATAAQATSTANLTNITGNKVVIVWTSACQQSQSNTVRVHVMKYIDGAPATATNANNDSFPITNTFTAANLNNGTQTTSTFNLSATNTTPYEFDTSAMNTGSAYSVNEVTSASTNFLPMGATCQDNHYVLQGYKMSGTSFADAASTQMSTSTPTFNNLTGDEYVIIYNNACGSTTGTITGTVGGHGTLAVTSVDAIQTTATADGTFGNGWKFVFHITTPDNEQNLAMKFANWINSANSNTTIPAANNIRISSGQADNNNATVLVTAANTYTTPTLHITGDLDPNTPGNQITVTVEAAVPSGTPNGTYTTNYGVQTTP